MAAGKTSPEMTRKYLTSSAAATVEAGSKIAGLLAAPSLVVLTGDLGAGKTTLVKGIAEGFRAAEEEDVTSPTFTLVHEYRGPSVNLFHIDLYRIDSDRELLTLGVDDLIDSRSILLIEWGEKFERFRRERDVEITIRRVRENEREINVILTAEARRRGQG
jgi:tRNA threonylcarbamoyladenosine biosynthesis protein TsaE